MPELPEVETIVRQLNQKIKNKTLSQIEVIDYAKKIKGELAKKALARVEEVKRRGKLLLFRLSNGYSFVIHLKLTGQLIYYPHLPVEMPKATHVVFSFSDGSALLFNDFRKFGFVKLMETKELESFIKEEGLGPEPLDLTLEQFRSLLSKKPAAKIKPLLMEQTFIAGIGNIYAQEACFQAGILPTRKVSSLSQEELRKLFDSLQKVLQLAIHHQGTSFDGVYVTAENERGTFDSYLKVYHQDKCAHCGSVIKRIELGGRGTYYCGKCQK